MSIAISGGNELNVRTNSRLSSIDNFLEQLDLFVREVLRQRTINKSDEARQVLTDLLEECIRNVILITNFTNYKLIITGEPAYNEPLGAKKKLVIEELRYEQTEEKSCKNTQLLAFFKKTNRSLIFF